MPELQSVGKIILEYWDVEPDKLDRWEEWFTTYYYGALTHVPGYLGQWTCRVRDGAHEETFGHPESGQVITFHPLLGQLGTRTDASVNFDVLLRGEWNVLGVQIMTADADLTTLFGDYMKGFEQLRPNWKQEHPDLESAADVVAREYFGLIKNHWDVFLDVPHCQWNAGPMEAQAGPSWLRQGLAAGS